MDKMNDLKMFIHNKIKSKVMNKSTGASDENCIPQFVQEDAIRLVGRNHLVANENLEWLSVPFTVLEEIFLNDMETFFLIWKYNLQYMTPITD